jgi:hypothetical protein
MDNQKSPSDYVSLEFTLPLKGTSSTSAAQSTSISNMGVIGNNGTTTCPAGLQLIPTFVSGGTGFDNSASYTYRSQFCCQVGSHLSGIFQADDWLTRAADGPTPVFYFKLHYSM